MKQLVILLALLGSSHADVTVTFHNTANAADKGISWQISTCVRVELHDVRVAKVAKNSTEGDRCVVVYTSWGCNGVGIKVSEDRYDNEPFRRAKSMSPCGSYRQDPVITEEVQPFNQLTKFTMRYHSLDLEIYTDEVLAYSDWYLESLPNATAYIKNIYGPIGRADNEKLYVYLSQTDRRVGTAQYNTFQEEEAFRNIAKVWGDRFHNGNIIGRPVEGHVEFDWLWNSIGCVLEHANNNVFSTAMNDIWRDCISLSHMLKYDLYLHLGLTDDAERVKRELMNYKQDSPRQNVYWFRDFLLPVYENYGSAKVYGRFLKLLAKEFPKQQRKQGERNVGLEYSRRLNVGEFVHFFSGAAGKNLKGLATRAFGWNSQWEAQFRNARHEFGNMRYSP